jgi:Spy/CpxP family protein refolding chaperone
MEKFNELEALVASMKEDITKIYDKSNKAAGVRVRKTLQDVKAIAQAIRVEISEQKKA